MTATVYVTRKDFPHYGQWARFAECDDLESAQRVAADMNREAQRDKTGFAYQVRYSKTIPLDHNQGHAAH